MSKEIFVEASKVVVKPSKVKNWHSFMHYFLEKAAKRLEDEKALAKVTGTRQGPPLAKCHKQDRDPNDLSRFLESGAPAKHGGRNTGCQQPYPQKRSVKFRKRNNRSTHK